MEYHSIRIFKLYLKDTDDYLRFIFLNIKIILMGFWSPLTELLPRPLECFWLHNSCGKYHWCVGEWIWGKWISLLKAIEQYNFLFQLQLYHCYVYMYGFWDYMTVLWNHRTGTFVSYLIFRKGCFGKLHVPLVLIKTQWKKIISI